MLGVFAHKTAIGDIMTPCEMNFREKLRWHCLLSIALFLFFSKIREMFHCYVR